MKIAVYNLEGKKLKDMELSEDVFGVEKNEFLLHQVYVAKKANRRKPIAHTKNRGEVAGSGIKPWRQKGTGRARVGSVRTPVWKGGGIVFGPTKERNFSKKVNNRANRKAIKMALSEKAKKGNMIVVDSFKLKEKKTKEFAKGMDNLKLKGKILLSLGEKEKDAYLYSRNIKNMKCIPAKIINVMDLLDYSKLLISEDSIKYLEKKYNR
ncbi:MAG: 50S ribosomal protein L4 [Candidatus Moranbacteria bacterium]|jgi:large subunit ribosomal protein L4|nr:50S ribosomal protein L4 [Candidatus Moranbacteria bacterium]MDD5652430.1 50S ribosomal protein L4 [Candidatus Moranbacteria bacterium]MDX9855630.1 50S ribosomal protein L4 [Candidatus Moranbacteria bacterium]